MGFRRLRLLPRLAKSRRRGGCSLASAYDFSKCSFDPYLAAATQQVTVGGEMAGSVFFALRLGCGTQLGQQGIRFVSKQIRVLCHNALRLVPGFSLDKLLQAHQQRRRRGRRLRLGYEFSQGCLHTHILRPLQYALVHLQLAQSVGIVLVLLDKFSQCLGGGICEQQRLVCTQHALVFFQAVHIDQT